MRDRIYITDADYDRLRRLIAGRRGAKMADNRYLEVLEQELDRAEVVEPDAIPRDVITMNSEVKLQDLDSGEIRVYKLIFPSDARARRTVFRCSRPSAPPCWGTGSAASSSGPFPGASGGSRCWRFCISRKAPR